MSGLSPAFRDELVPLFDALAAAVGLPALEPRMSRDSYSVKVAAGQVLVPVRFEVHWRRFEKVPTDLVRDAAYAARRSTMDPFDEADCQTFAQVFLRDHVLGGT